MNHQTADDKKSEGRAGEGSTNEDRSTYAAKASDSLAHQETAVGERFLNFTIRFFNMARSQYQQQNQIRANTLAFQTMVILNQPERTEPTMSELADELQITKQQLTKLVNDLEEKSLVERHHDSRNRRLVYLRITPRGTHILQQLKDAMLCCTIGGLSSFSQDELVQLDQCLSTLSLLLEKFKPCALEQELNEEFKRL